MPNPADVSVVIPTYNRADCVGLAIESVLRQTVGCREIIVIDDGSTDGTREVLNGYGDRIRPVYQCNKGVSAARNAGIDSASSEWIAFLDSDDEWESRRIEWFAQDNLRWPQAVAHVGNATFMSQEVALKDHLSLHRMTARPGYTELVDRPLLLHLRLQFLTPTFVVRRNCLQAEGGFDSAAPIFEDYRLFTCIALRGNWVRREDIVARIFRRGPDASNAFVNLPERALRAANSCIGTYLNLLSRDGLSRQERKLVRGRLASYRAQVAAHERSSGHWKAAFGGFVQSVLDFPSLTAVTRAVVGASCGEPGLHLLARMKTKQPRYTTSR